MRKDIEVPEVTGVFVAAVRVFNKSLQVEEWTAYLINERSDDLEMVLIVSKGFDATRKTSIMRKKLDQLPKKSFAKVEFLQDDVLALQNEFHVSFFVQNKMFDKKFVFQKNAINTNAQRDIPVMDVKGVLAN
jgi:hypothetical protein